MRRLTAAAVGAMISNVTDCADFIRVSRSSLSEFWADLFSKTGQSSVLARRQHPRRGNMRRMMSITAAVALTASAALSRRASRAGALSQSEGRRGQRQRRADRKNPILLGRPELLLVSRRLAWAGLVLVRLCPDLWLWLGRRLWLARLGRARLSRLARGVWPLAWRRTPAGTAAAYIMAAAGMAAVAGAWRRLAWRRLCGGWHGGGFHGGGFHGGGFHGGGFHGGADNPERRTRDRPNSGARHRLSRISTTPSIRLLASSHAEVISRRRGRRRAVVVAIA